MVLVAGDWAGVIIADVVLSQGSFGTGISASCLGLKMPEFIIISLSRCLLGPGVWVLSGIGDHEGDEIGLTSPGGPLAGVEGGVFMVVPLLGSIK